MTRRAFPLSAEQIPPRGTGQGAGQRGQASQPQQRQRHLPPPSPSMWTAMSAASSAAASPPRCISAARWTACWAAASATARRSMATSAARSAVSIGLRSSFGAKSAAPSAAASGKARKSAVIWTGPVGANGRARSRPHLRSYRRQPDRYGGQRCAPAPIGGNMSGEIMATSAVSAPQQTDAGRRSARPCRGSIFGKVMGDVTGTVDSDVTEIKGRPRSGAVIKGTCGSSARQNNGGTVLGGIVRMG